ncbi:U32 family peptidase [Ferrimonas senticii]|uniref:U32 family peptidase n=1 Tax=Ferrimonas senticii TaxID=394566 RepID=UPI0003F6EF2C|nr:U32 family peptidase [Ferrimonas senticii]
MKLSLAFNCWPQPRQQQLAQLEQLKTLPVQRIYLGETVCSQRDRLSPRELAEFAEVLAADNKQLVISSLNLIASDRDIRLLERICALPNITIEANDMAAVAAAHQAGLPFVAGSSLNIYNAASIKWLLSLGMVGYQPPLEITHDSLQTLMDDCQQLGLRQQFELELLGWGYPTLAVSARCTSARVHGRNRKLCQKICQSQGAELAHSLDGQPMFAVNGTQIQAASPVDLLPYLNQLTDLGVDWLRILPQSLAALDWLTELAEAIERQQPQFNAPEAGRAPLWRRANIGAELCAD